MSSTTIIRGSGAIPVRSKERFVILDALRGFALLGICLANFPEFSLYSFLSSVDTEAMPTAGIDFFTKYFLYIFIDGKFYTIFSLLFGIGFSIIITNVMKRGGNAMKVFYRRMLVLFIIGLIHLLMVWSGDILMLYALVGMLLPLFRNFSDRALLWIALFSLFLPVAIDWICEVSDIHPSAWLVGRQWYFCSIYGITDANFAYWLHDATSYNDVMKFLIQGAFERMQEFVDGNRYFKVFGLFLIGYVIGRNRLYGDLLSYSPILKKFAFFGLLIGLPLSCLYAWSGMTGKPLGLGIHSLIYFLSVYIMSFGYIALFCLVYCHAKEAALWKWLSFPGRMALTGYIGQSLVGMLIFYGIGFGLGAYMGLIYVEIIAVGVFLFEIFFSSLWLKVFRFGPLEWLWRCFTYGKLFQIR